MVVSRGKGFTMDINSLGRGNSLILGSLPSLVMLQVRAEWTQMSCLSRSKSFIMADMGVGGSPGWTWRKGSGVPEVSTRLIKNLTPLREK